MSEFFVQVEGYETKDENGERHIIVEGNDIIAEVYGGSYAGNL